jgi:hypothetical protein
MKKSKGTSQKFVEQAESTKLDVYIYDKPKSGNKIKNIPNRIQGVWEKSNNAHSSPVKMWAYPNGRVPQGLDELKEVHGVWGYKPGVDPDKCEPEEMWFFPPDSKLPSFFTPKGVWTFPLIKRDVSELSPNQTAFLGLGTSTKSEKLDVGGDWRLLYTADDKKMKSRVPE